MPQAQFVLVKLWVGPYWLISSVPAAAAFEDVRATLIVTWRGRRWTARNEKPAAACVCDFKITDSDLREKLLLKIDTLSSGWILSPQMFGAPATPRLSDILRVPLFPWASVETGSDLYVGPEISLRRAAGETKMHIPSHLAVPISSSLLMVSPVLIDPLFPNCAC